MTKTLFVRGLSLVLACVIGSAPGIAFAQDTQPEAPSAGSERLYIPTLANRSWSGTITNYAALPRAVNVPYLSDLLDGQGGIQRLPSMAVFWYGRVQDTQNYTDVRIATNNTHLVVYVASFDRHLWYDTSPAAGDLTAWDGATVYLRTGGQINGLGSDTFKLTAQLNNGGAVPSAGKLSQRGTGGSWATTSVAFEASAGWRGSNINNADDDRGWAITFRIPFASLGVSRPADGAATWALAVVTHDRDNGGVQPETFWPETFQSTNASTWGGVRWGQPTYTPAASSIGGTVMIKQGVNGATVSDSDLGGATSNQCPGDTNYIWNEWGNANYANEPGMNIQNQSDISDWPCFAKTYLNFPLSQIPAGMVIRRATLQLHQFGGSGTASNGQSAADTYIQVFRIGGSWSESTITWNNAPLPIENYGGTWVGQVVNCGAPGGLAWPCVRRDWDVTRLVADAYAAGEPARIGLYSADSDYSTGKYFTSSEAGDWNVAGRPGLEIEWGRP